MAERDDGRLCAIYRDGIWKNRIEWEAAYHCALATELPRAGFPIHRMIGNGGRYFEIDGIPEQLTKRWSGRSVEVTEHMDALAAEFLERYGREPTQVELRRAVVRSRRRKTVTAKTGLRHYCRGVAALHDITPASLAELRRTGRARTDAQARALVAAELLGPDGLTSEQATFRGSDLRVAAFRHGAGLLDVGQVEQLVLDLQRSGELRRTGEDRWTTRRMWELEHRVLAWHEERTADPVANREHQTPTQHQLVRSLTSRDGGADVRLSMEQLEVLRGMLSRRTSTVRGWAGSGKGAIARAAGAIWRDQGRRVIAMAVAGARAAEIAAYLGEGTEHMTIGQFLHRTGRGKLALQNSDVLVLDEASQVSTEQWAALADAIGTTATIVMLGDEAQQPRSSLHERHFQLITTPRTDDRSTDSG
jgi:AAA domain/TrwC relaxase